MWITIGFERGVLLYNVKIIRKKKKKIVKILKSPRPAQIQAPDMPIARIENSELLNVIAQQ